VPSPVLVREALERGGVSGALLRAGIAVAAAASEGEDGPPIAAGAGGVAELARRTGLSRAEVSEGIRVLQETGALAVREDRFRLDSDLYCSLPALAAVDWEAVREAVGAGRGRMAPALALLRELARLSRRAGDGAGEWLQPAVQELVEETLYGRTAVTQALGELLTSGLVAKAEQPSRRGLRVRLTRRAFGGAAAGGAAPERRAEPGTTSPGGVSVEIGGAVVGVPAGSRLELPSGMNYRLEIAPDGRAIIRVDD
jgi:DNA-binding transcriptional ArsR family regulator